MELDELEIAQDGAGPRRHEPGRCRWRRAGWSWRHRDRRRRRSPARRHARADAARRSSRRPRTPVTTPSSSIRSVALKPSSTVIEGVAAHRPDQRLQDLACRMRRPPAWTTRRRLCAASSPSARLPSASRSKPTPQPISASMQPAASPVTLPDDRLVAEPGPGADGVGGMQCRRVVRPECGGDAALRPAGGGFRLQAAPGSRAVTGAGARLSAVARPAIPAPTTTTPSSWCPVGEVVAAHPIGRACARPPGARDRRPQGRSRRHGSSSPAPAGSRAG